MLQLKQGAKPFDGVEVRHVSGILSLGATKMTTSKLTSTGHHSHIYMLSSQSIRSRHDSLDCSRFVTGKVMFCSAKKCYEKMQRFGKPLVGTLFAARKRFDVSRIDHMAIWQGFITRY